MTLLIFNLISACALPLSILSFLFTTVQCDNFREGGYSSASWGTSLDRRTNPERTITIVTDTLHVESVHSVGPGPAHSWVVFGETANEKPLRVEVVSPIRYQNPAGLAVSVIELLGAREDIGELDFPLPAHTSRTNLRLKKTTTLRNIEIFDPSLEVYEPGVYIMGVERLPGPVLALALKCRNKGKLYSIGDELQNSHGFAQALVMREELGPNHPDDSQQVFPSWPVLGGPNTEARWYADRWAKNARIEKMRPVFVPYHGRDRMMEFINEVSRELASRTRTIEMDHIFFEAPMPQPRSQGAPRQASVAAVYELRFRGHNFAGEFEVHRLMSPSSFQVWERLPYNRKLAPFHRGQSIVSLSRDPRLTSGYLLPDAIGSLPLLWKDPIRSSRPETSTRVT